MLHSHPFSTRLQQIYQTKCDQTYKPTNKEQMKINFQINNYSFEQLQLL